jgi:hypothetical protein
MVTTMSKSPEVTDPREQLRRLVDDLDEEPPGEEETRLLLEAAGVDVPAAVARLHARIAAHEAVAPPSAGVRPPLACPNSEAPPSVEVEPMARSFLEPKIGRRGVTPAVAFLAASCGAVAVAVAWSFAAQPDGRSVSSRTPASATAAAPDAGAEPAGPPGYRGVTDTILTDTPAGARHSPPVATAGQ